MTTAVRALISQFERLNEEERRQAAQEILRRTGQMDYGPLTDDELTAIADDAFLTMDEEESSS